MKSSTTMNKASDVTSRQRSLLEPHAKQAQGHPTAVASIEDLEARRKGFESNVNRDWNPPMVPHHRIHLDEAAGYGRNGDSTKASNTVIKAPEELSKCASQYTPASLYGFVMIKLFDADRVHGDGGRCIGLTKRQSSNGQCRLPVEAITPLSTTGARSNQPDVKEEGKREPKGDSATLDLNKEGREELLGGEQTNPKKERMDKLSGGLSKGEIGPTFEAVTPPSTTSAKSAHLDINKEGREKLWGGEQRNPNDGHMDKLSWGLSKREIGPTFEAVTPPSTTSAESVHLDLNKEGREEHLGGEQTNPNDERMDKLSGGLSKGEIDLTFEAVTPPSTTGADFAPVTANEVGNCKVNVDASAPPRRASFGQPPRRAHRGGLGEDRSIGVEETYVDDIDVGKAKLIVGEEAEEEGEERRGRRRGGGRGGAYLCTPPSLLSVPLTP